MNLHQHISGEIGCYFDCVATSSISWIVILLATCALLMFITYLIILNPDYRIKIFTFGQFLIVMTIWLSIATMKCDSMFIINVYAIYTLITLTIMLSIPRIYDKILIKRWKASIITDVLVWPQEFVDQLLGEAKVYYYDSAVPRAFSSGRSIFLSVGLLEMLSERELKAVLAHEAWHLKHMNKTHWLKQLSIITFLPFIRSEFEFMADQYALNIIGKDALESARSKLFSPN